jgi:galactose-1-phosphate uridylyltransferase
MPDAGHEYQLQRLREAIELERRAHAALMACQDRVAQEWAGLLDCGAEIPEALEHQYHEAIAAIAESVGGGEFALDIPKKIGQC